MARTEPNSRHGAGRAGRALPAEPETIDLPPGQSAYDLEELRRRVAGRLAERLAARVTDRLTDRLAGRPTSRSVPRGSVCPACGRALPVDEATHSREPRSPKGTGRNARLFVPSIGSQEDR